MVRLVAFACLLAALAGIGFAGMELRRTIVATQTAEQQIDVADNMPPPGAIQTTPAPIQTWPALFGEVVVVQPQPPAPPQPPQPQAPPVSSLGYILKGTVVLGGDTWAILSHPTGERILRVGDSLVEGAEVIDVNAEGLWLKTSRGKEVIAFEE